jgi:hypothetical protein
LRELFVTIVSICELGVSFVAPLFITSQQASVEGSKPYLFPAMRNNSMGTRDL